MANDTNKIKLLVLWDILCKNTDENHAMNSDEIREELAKRGISVMRKVVATDIAALNKYGYEVLSYKKKYYYYYVVSRPLETAEVVMLADVIKASKLTSTQKNIMIEKLSGTLCSHQAENLSKHIISLDKSRKGSSSLIYNVDAIERGIEENKQISFLYFDYDEKHKKVYRKNGDRYMVNPAFMVWNRDNYGIKHGLVSDYLRVAEENGVVVINIVAIKGITEPNGYGFNFGITNIYESNLSRTFTFIFYAKDADGNIAYAVPQFADYSSLQAGEMTTEELIQKAEQANDVQSSFRSIVLKLQELIDSVWIYVVIAFSSVVAVWGAYIGIRVTVAKKNEEKINARGMVKQLAVGIIVMFVLAMGTPLVINGLSHWVTW